MPQLTRSTSPGLEPERAQGRSSLFDRNRDGSLILTFPEGDEYVTVTVRSYNDLPREQKGRIEFLKYKDNRKQASYFYITTTGKLAPCEFFNGEWYELHTWAEGYRTARSLAFDDQELRINDLLPKDTSSGGTPPEEVIEFSVEPTRIAMDSPLDQGMSLLSMGDELEEHIASATATVAMTQLQPTGGGGGPSGPSGSGGSGGPGGPGGPGNPGGPGGGPTNANQANNVETGRARGFRLLSNIISDVVTAGSDAR
jgi:hypothetical protein